MNDYGKLIITLDDNLKICRAENEKLRAEIERLKEFHREDMRVTNESASFHMQECAMLRARIEVLAIADSIDKDSLLENEKIHEYWQRHGIKGHHSIFEWLDWLVKEKNDKDRKAACGGDSVRMAKARAAKE